MSEPTPHTQKRLLQLVRRLLSKDVTFRAITARSRGAWPVHLVDALQIIASMDGLLARRAIEMVAESRNKKSNIRNMPSHDWRLPLPHPLDGDWRFDKLTRVSLLRALLVASNGGKILLVGMPTVVLTAADSGFDDRIIYTAREGDPVTDMLARFAPQAKRIPIEDCDGKLAECAAVDPPWYDDVGVPMVERAAAGTAPGGTVFVCGPDEMTGASAAQILRNIQKHGARFGVSDFHPVARARYETPLFEMMTLRALDVHGYHPQWRTGLVYRGTRLPSKITLSSLPEEAGWSEEMVGTCRIRTRPLLEAAKVGELLSIIPSVSRTHSSRKSVNVLTSGNAAGVIQLSAGGDIPELLRRNAIKETRLAQRLLPLVPRLGAPFHRSQENNGLTPSPQTTYSVPN